MIDLTAELSLFWDIGLVIAAATVLAYIAKLLRQPVVLAYVIAGVLIGPGGLKLITNQDVIKTLSEFGIAFLLFIVGLELDVRKLKTVGLSAVFIALVNSSIMFLFGFTISKTCGFTGLAPLYLGLALAFSSTMIVVKLLSDKNELDTLHGRVIVGILLTEDVMAIMALSLLSNPEALSLNLFSWSFAKGVILLLATILASRLVLPSLFRFVSKSQELMFLTALSICFVFAATAQVFGFSIAIGSFLGGVAIASFPYNIEIVGMVQSLRDFFSTIFFVSLGMGIGISFNYALLAPLALSLLLVLLLKPLLLMVLSSGFGYSIRTSFLTGMSLSQISEFSLIIVIQGIKHGQIDQQVFSLTVLTALITITITSYLIKFDEILYRVLAGRLTFLSGIRFVQQKTLYEYKTPRLSGQRKHVVVCGCHRMGYSIVKTLRRMDRDILVVEFDPDIMQSLSAEGIPSIYGDIGNVEILHRLDLPDADIIISTVPILDDNLILIEEAKKINPRIAVIVTASTLDHAQELYSAGADYVVLPKWLAGEKAAEVIEHYLHNPTALEHSKREHLRQIEHIKQEEFIDKDKTTLLSAIHKRLKRTYEEE
jgi:Kef-type K+ transport system membrane component KefB/Trk K+ transport system NAD-binding subunit